MKPIRLTNVDQYRQVSVGTGGTLEGSSRARHTCSKREDAGVADPNSKGSKERYSLGQNTTCK